MQDADIELGWLNNLTLLDTDIELFRAVLSVVNDWMLSRGIEPGFVMSVRVPRGDDEPESVQVEIEALDGWTVQARIRRSGTNDVRILAVGHQGRRTWEIRDAEAIKS